MGKEKEEGKKTPTKTKGLKEEAQNNQVSVPGSGNLLLEPSELPLKLFISRQLE